MRRRTPQEMQVLRIFSDDIHMEFGLDKCAKIVLKRGKLVQSQNLILDFNREYNSSKRDKHTNTQGLKKVRAYNINKRKKE